MWLPENDGVDHINIYSKGKTKLGRSLTNFADIDIRIPNIGMFRTGEGLWYSLMYPEHILTFKTLTGWECKSFGKQLQSEETHITLLSSDPKFRDTIRFGMRLKLTQHSWLWDLLETSSLPLAHYYVYGGKAKVAGFEWITEYWEELRTRIKNGEVL